MKYLPVFEQHPLTIEPGGMLLFLLLVGIFRHFES